MKPQQYRPEYTPKETRLLRVKKLQDEYNDYLRELTDREINKICDSEHFQLMEIKINGVKHNQ